MSVGLAFSKPGLRRNPLKNLPHNRDFVISCVYYFALERAREVRVCHFGIRHLRHRRTQGQRRPTPAEEWAACIISGGMQHTQKSADLTAEQERRSKAKA